MLDHVRAWRWLKLILEGVQDPILRNSILVEMRKKALNNWGFDPETGAVAKNAQPELDPWESEFVQDVKDCILYGVDTRKEKRKEIERSAFASMVQFVREGNTLNDMPEDLRNDPCIIDLYLKAVHKECDDLCNAADDLLKKFLT